MSSDLDDLRERILAEKALAEAAQREGTPWMDTGDGGAVRYRIGSSVAVPEFIAAHDPASVIARCDADLALLDWYIGEVTPGDEWVDPDVALAFAGYAAALAPVRTCLLDRYPAPSTPEEDDQA